MKGTDKFRPLRNCPFINERDIWTLCREACWAQTSIRLASNLFRAPNSRSGGREFESPMWRQWLNSGKILGVRSFYRGDPDVITWSCQSVWLPNIGSLARLWQTHLPDTTADSTSLLNQAHVQYQCDTEGSTVEKRAETQISIRLAISLERLSPEVSSNPLCSGNSVQWLKTWKDPWGHFSLQQPLCLG